MSVTLIVIGLLVSIGVVVLLFILSVVFDVVEHVRRERGENDWDD